MQLEKRKCTEATSNSGVRNISVFIRNIGEMGWIPFLIIYSKHFSLSLAHFHFSIFYFKDTLLG